LTHTRLEQGTQTYSSMGKLPALDNHESIYTNQSSDNMIHLTARARLTGMASDVVNHRVSICVAGAEAVTADPEVLVNDQTFRHQGRVAAGEIVRFAIPSPSSFRDVYEVRAGGSARIAPGFCTRLCLQRKLIDGIDWYHRTRDTADGRFARMDLTFKRAMNYRCSIDELLDRLVLAPLPVFERPQKASLAGSRLRR
jgi:hypothetical protein